MERQITTEEPKQSSVLTGEVNSSPKNLPDWRTAMKELREMLGDGPSLEDEFMEQRRAEKW